MILRLSRRDTLLLKRMAPYGHTTLDVVLRWFPETSRMAARSWLKRLRQSGWLDSAPLDERRKYYRFTNKTVELLRKQGCQVSRAATRPLKPNRKAEKHAWLLFLSNSAVSERTAFRPALERERFPELAQHLQSGKADPFRQQLFYRSETSIGLFVLDRGQANFVTGKLQPLVMGIREHPFFAPVGWQTNFELTIATSTASRQRELIAEMEADPPNFFWQVIVLEEIATLLPRRRNWNASPVVNERNDHDVTP